MGRRQTKEGSLRGKALRRLAYALLVYLIGLTLPREADALVKQLVKVEVVACEETNRI